MRRKLLHLQRGRTDSSKAWSAEKECSQAPTAESSDARISSLEGLGGGSDAMVVGNRRYAGSKVRILNEQFIELFDTDLVTVNPAKKPKWL